MIARRLAVACLFAALAPAAAREKNDGATLQFRIHGSILPGYSKADATGASQPMFDFIGGKLGERIECGVHDGTSADALFDLGKKLSGGQVHAAAVWGIEYGWLREKHPQLKVLVVVSLGTKNEANRTKL